MVVWQALTHGLYGCIGGYSGGGTFQLEKFWLSGAEAILDLDISISDWNTDGIVAAEVCQDVVLAYHDEARWLDWDTLHLLPARKKELVQRDDLLFGGESVPAELVGVFGKVGLTIKP